MSLMLRWTTLMCPQSPDVTQSQSLETIMHAEAMLGLSEKPRFLKGKCIPCYLHETNLVAETVAETVARFQKTNHPVNVSDRARRFSRRTRTGAIDDEKLSKFRKIYDNWKVSWVMSRA